MKETGNEIRKLGKKQARIYKHLEIREIDVQNTVQKRKRKRSYLATSLMGDWVFFSLKRSLDWSTRHTIERTIEDRKILQDQVNTKRIRSDFFPRIRTLTRDLDKLCIYSDKTKRDLLIILKYIDTFFNDMKKSIVEFMAIFQNEPKVDNLRNKLAEIEDMKARITESIKKNELDTEQMEEFIANFNKKVPRVIYAIRSYCMIHLREIKNMKNPDEFLKKHPNIR